MTIDDPNHEIAAKLLVAAKAGDPAAFVKLVASTERIAKEIATKLLRNHHQAEDVVQAAYLVAWQKIGTCNGPLFDPWFYRIVHNRALNFMRKKPMQSLGCDLAHSADMERAADESRDTSQESLRLEAADKLHKSVERLPEFLKKICILFYFVGLSLADVAKTAQITPDAAKAGLYRARKLLKEDLAGDRSESS